MNIILKLYLATDVATVSATLTTLGATNISTLTALNLIMIAEWPLQQLPTQSDLNQQVEFIEWSNFDFAVQTMQRDVDWALDRIDQELRPLNKTYRYNRTASNVDVYVMDTGINVFHQEFTNVDRLYDYRVDLPITDPDFLLSSAAGFAYDNVGHGTYVASLIGGKTFGVAKGANLKSVKVFTENMQSSLGYVLQGLNAILVDHLAKPAIPLPGHRPSIVNMSFASTTLGSTATLKSAITLMQSAGIIFIAAAGNQGIEISTGTDMVMPALIPDVISVGATTQTDMVARSLSPNKNGIIEPNLSGMVGSNYGDGIDLFAPGDKVMGAWTSRSDYRYDNTHELSGTSASAALTSGVVALYMEGWASILASDRTSSAIKTFLQDTASQNNLTNIDSASPNTLLHSIFNAGYLDWVTPQSTILFELVEGSYGEKQVDAVNGDGSSFPSEIQYTFSTPAFETSANTAGFKLTSDGLIYGNATLISPIDIGYVAKSTLPQDEQDKFNSSVVGFVDVLISLDISDKVSNSSQPQYPSVTRLFYIRVLDYNHPPVWTPISQTINLNQFYPVGTFTIGNAIAVNFQDAIDPDVTDPNGDVLIWNNISGVPVVHNGILPPGIALSTVGILGGTLLPFDALTKDFNFTIRVFDGQFYVDQAFVVTVTRNVALNNPPVWDNAISPDYTISSLITYQLGQNISIGVVATDPDGDALSYISSSITGAVPPTNIPGTGGYNPVLPDRYHDLPANLSVLSDGSIFGNVDIANPPGEYYFQINAIDAYGGVTPRIFLMILSVTPTTSSTVSGIILWITPEGLLGDVDETYPSPFGIDASSNNNDISYVLASGPLPPGLSINVDTGLIVGYAGYVPFDTQFTFTAQAFVSANPSIFAYREFSIIIKYKFVNPISMFKCKVWGNQKLALNSFRTSPSVITKFNNSIKAYRPSDPNFTSQFEIYIMGGMDVLTPTQIRTIMLDDVSIAPPETFTKTNTIPAQNYIRPITVIGGDLKTSVVRNSNGDELYDVVYLELYDPNNLAGDTSLVIPHPNPLATKLYPTSVNNWRSDLSNDSALITERQPKWQTTEQVLGDPTTAIGFTLALPLFYLMPGSGTNLIISLGLDNSLSLFKGESFILDRFVWSDWTDTAQIKERIFKFLPGDIYK